MKKGQEERNILQAIKRRKGNWIGHILHTNCLLKHIIARQDWRTEVTGTRGRRGKQLLDGLKEKIGYWKLKEEELDRSLCRTDFGRDCGPAVRRDEGRCERAFLLCINSDRRRLIGTVTVYLNLRKQPAKCYIWSTALHGPAIWILRTVQGEHKVFPLLQTFMPKL